MFIDLYSFGVFSYIVSLNRVEIKVRVYLICLYGKTKGINSVKNYLFKNRKVVEYMDIGVLLFICSVVVGLLVVIYMWYTF
mgnify:FL=1